jgi:tRNA(Ile)-lysidine synthase
MLLVKIKETLNRFHMLSPGERVVVAVSGGPDSVCLLSALHELSAELRVSLHIAHLDHMFRGKESEAEAHFVEALAKDIGIPATIEQIDVPRFCRERGLSSQAGAREVRYLFLARIARAVGAACIATGHTASDQAETFLIRLLRGAGVSGLSAIPPVRDSIIRPLIEVTRAEVLDYLQQAGRSFVTDPSNNKPLYTRNRVRQEIVPVLRQFNPRIEETLASEAGLLRDEDEAADARAASLVRELCTWETNGGTLQRDPFNALPDAVKRRILRHIMAETGLNPAGISRVRVDEALAFMASCQSGRSLALGGGITIQREYDRFLFTPAAPVPQLSRVLDLPGTTLIPDLGLEVETCLAEPGETRRESENYRWQGVFDYDKIAPHLTIRTRQPGDWFCPSGMGGRSKKLQDYLVDEKVPRSERDRVPLLVAGDGFLWVVGHRTDHRYLTGPETKRILSVRIGVMQDRNR